MTQKVQTLAAVTHPPSDLLADAWAILAQRPDWHARAFELKKAYFFALFSRLVYSHVPQFELADRSRVHLVPCEAYQQMVLGSNAPTASAILRQNDILEFFVIERRYVIVLGVKTGDVVVVAVRGTKYLYDWKVNLNAKRLALFGSGTTLFLHQGFCRAIASCFDELAERLAPYLEADVPIYATGHSLGGAMAAILQAIYGRQRQGKNRRVYWGPDHIAIDGAYTFGMPRYANLNVITWRPAPHHLFNKEDIVPRVPPEWMGFATCLTERVMSDTELSFTDGRSGSSFAAWLLTLVTGKAITNHFMEVYLDRLRARLGTLP